ncbi:hypothetical protein LSUE1_G000595 [Lachnellula suecica]|uniref:Uncharacterized protein n=1 Tax=Lachnellula suecica TaxID=602035 RepID=A0A8T9CJY9_9HELO|nr:hypothetical protein LSUE1_G000595 [Lachnellula suecica]
MSQFNTPTGPNGCSPSWKCSPILITRGLLRSVPDGETGERYNYIGWQRDCFPQETVKLHIGGKELPATETYPKYTLDSIKPTRYDDAAISSYREFVALRAEGIIPADALARIVAEIPAQDLAIQWDLCFDIIALEYERGRTQDLMFKSHFTPVKEGILERVVRLCVIIPSGVQLGFHLCYGDLRHKHFVEPEDLGLLVELANDIVERVGIPIHSVDWVHVPVPKGRTDVAYFEPLKNLKINGSHLYLGLVHANDEAGTMERIRVAQSICKEPFGLATECGLGRTPRDELDSILEISRRVTSP